MAERVLVAMSGGVDSSVALLEILEAGYEPIGVTMKLWEYRDMGGNLLGESNCCPVEAINNARDVCVSLGVRHYTLDFSDVFQETVVNNFVDEYLAGHTPNPCVRCNSFVKWDALLEQADELGVDKISTGHYARIDRDDRGHPRILMGIDQHKDQSYVLWGIPRESMSRTLFPLGDYTKADVRALARKHNLITAQIPESQDICFVADGDYNRFLSEQAGNRMMNIGEGVIVDEGGRTVGRHPGYTHYTIGQRRGLGIAHPEPLYVKELDPATNRIVVGERDSIYKTDCLVSQLNWLVDKPIDGMQIHARIRYNSPGTTATIRHEGDNIQLHFDEPQSAITLGQSAVLYDGDILMGGGIISKVNL